jgi:malonyl CoA-acyl carrier protein transacylase
MPGLPDEEIDRLVTEIQSTASNKVMLVLVNGKVMVMPYREK